MLYGAVFIQTFINFQRNVFAYTLNVLFSSITTLIYGIIGTLQKKKKKKKKEFLMRYESNKKKKR